MAAYRTMRERMPPLNSKNSNSRQYVWLWKKEKEITDGTARNQGDEQE